MSDRPQPSELLAAAVIAVTLAVFSVWASCAPVEAGVRPPECPEPAEGGIAYEHTHPAVRSYADRLGNVVVVGKPEFVLSYRPDDGAYVHDLHGDRDGQVEERIAAESGTRCLQSLRIARVRSFGLHLAVICMPHEVREGDLISPKP